MEHWVVYYIGIGYNKMYAPNSKDAFQRLNWWDISINPLKISRYTINSDVRILSKVFNVLILNFNYIFFILLFFVKLDFFHFLVFLCFVHISIDFYDSTSSFSDFSLFYDHLRPYSNRFQRKLKWKVNKLSTTFLLETFKKILRWEISA